MFPAVKSYNNYRVYLSDLSEYQRSDKNYKNLSWFAKELDLSVSFFSRVLSGQRNLSVSGARKVARNLKLSEEEANYFCDLVELELSEDEGTRQQLLMRIEEFSHSAKFLSIEAFKVVSEWYHFAILSLSNLRSFQGSEQWISRRLGIPEAVARKAVYRLIRVGLLKKEGDLILPTGTENLQTPHDVPSEAVRENHKQHLAIAIEKIEQVNVKNREFINRTLGVRYKDLPRAKQKIRNFMDEFNREFDNTSAKDIYQINLQFYKLSTEEEK